MAPLKSFHVLGLFSPTVYDIQVELPHTEDLLFAIVLLIWVGGFVFLIKSLQLCED